MLTLSLHERLDANTAIMRCSTGNDATFSYVLRRPAELSHDCFSAKRRPQPLLNCQFPCCLHFDRRRALHLHLQLTINTQSVTSTQDCELVAELPKFRIPWKTSDGPLQLNRMDFEVF